MTRFFGLRVLAKLVLILSKEDTIDVLFNLSLYNRVIFKEYDRY